MVEKGEKRPSRLLNLATKQVQGRLMPFEERVSNMKIPQSARPGNERSLVISVTTVSGKDGRN